MVAMLRRVRRVSLSSAVVSPSRLWPSHHPASPSSEGRGLAGGRRLYALQHCFGVSPAFFGVSVVTRPLRVAVTVLGSGLLQKRNAAFTELISYCGTVLSDNFSSFKRIIVSNGKAEAHRAGVLEHAASDPYHGPCGDDGIWAVL